MSFFSKNRAFTLVELLVSVAIIGALAALLLPSLGKMQKVSMRSKCASNLKQIGAGLLAYAGENQGRLPPGGTWDREIAPYVGCSNPSSTQDFPLLRCPMDKIKRSSGFPRSYIASAKSSSDDTVGVFSTWANGVETGSSRRLQELPRPSFTFMIVELFNDANPGTQFSKAFAYGQAPLWLNKESKQPKLPDGTYYHQTGQNYLFCDGHVELLNFEGVRETIPGFGDGGHWRAIPK